MSWEEDFRKDPRVKKARQLIFEAEREHRITLPKLRAAAEACGCGHRRDRHAPSHDINYAEGPCHECDCLHFMQGKL